MKEKKLSKVALDYFRQVGREGGALGGKKAAASMTPEQRTARAKKAAAASAKIRAKKSEQ